MKILITISFIVLNQTSIFCQQAHHRFLSKEYPSDPTIERFVKLKPYWAIQKQSTVQPKLSAEYFYIKPKNYWNASLSEALSGRLVMDRKKEFAPVLLYDGRYVAHSIPASAGSQPYQWVPAQKAKYSFAETMASEVIGSFLRKKPSNRNGYYTTSGIKY